MRLQTQTEIRCAVTDISGRGEAGGTVTDSSSDAMRVQAFAVLLRETGGTGLFNVSLSLGLWR